MSIHHIRSTRRWHKSASLAFLVIALLHAFSGSALASTAGLINGGFKDPRGNCSLSGWTYTNGNTSLQTESGGNCYAQLTLTVPSNDWSRMPAGYASSPTLVKVSLQQRFLVSSTDNTLSLSLIPLSNSSSAFPAQTISLYNAAGEQIYLKSRNVSASGNLETYLFSYDLSAYANTYVTLKIELAADPAITGSPSWVQLKVDGDEFYQNSGGGPTETPIPKVW